MKNIPVITSAPIKYVIPGYDLYDSFDLVSQGKLEAPLVRNPKKLVTSHRFAFDISAITKIYTAPRGQTFQTGRLLKPSHAVIEPTELLDNIKFSLTPLLPKRKFFTLPLDQALSNARASFVDKLFNNELTETFDQVKTRIFRLLDLLASEKEASMCIGHSFYIKILEIAYNRPESLNDIRNFRSAFEPEHKPYEPLEGITLHF